MSTWQDVKVHPLFLCNYPGYYSIHSTPSPENYTLPDACSLIFHSMSASSFLHDWSTHRYEFPGIILSLGQYSFQSVVVELDGGSALNNHGKKCCPWRPKLGTPQMSIYRGCIKKLQYIHIMESASAIQRIKQLLYATTSMTLRGIIRTERRQTQKRTSHMISFTCKFRESKATL